MENLRKGGKQEEAKRYENFMNRCAEKYGAEILERGRDLKKLLEISL